MIVLITGASHVGKTVVAQRLLETYHYPYLSLDHLKMGLIRSGQIKLTPEDDEALTAIMWPIVKEMVKTAIENKQHLIVEGCYIPFDWRDSFGEEYLAKIRYYCLVMTENYIQQHFKIIKNYANVIESRMDDSSCTLETALAENGHYLSMCQKYHCPYLLIDQDYQVLIDLENKKG